MKVVHIVSNLDDRFGGPSKSVPSLAASLEREGVEGHIVYNKILTAEHNEVVGLHQLSTTGVKTFFKGSLYYSPEMTGTMARVASDADLIHIHSMWRCNAMTAYRFAKERGIPYVVSTRSNLYRDSLLRSPIKKRIMWNIFVSRMLANAAFIHATDESELTAIRELGIKTPVSVIPNGINMDLLEGANLAQPRERIVLFMSRIHQRKGIEELISAWLGMDLRVRGWQLLIAGHCESRRYLNLLKSRCSGCDTVKFVGHVTGNEKADLLKRSSIFVLPTYFENFGIAVGEAMYSGNAILTTTQTPWGKHGSVIGEIIKPKDIYALRDALCNLMTLHESGDIAVVRHACKSIAGHYRWPRVAAEMKLRYKEAIGYAESSSECGKGAGGTRSSC